MDGWMGLTRPSTASPSIHPSMRHAPLIPAIQYTNSHSAGRETDHGLNDRLLHQWQPAPIAVHVCVCVRLRASDCPSPFITSHRSFVGRSLARWSVPLFIWPVVRLPCRGGLGRVGRRCPSRPRQPMCSCTSNAAADAPIGTHTHTHTRVDGWMDQHTHLKRSIHPNDRRTAAKCVWLADR